MNPKVKKRLRVLAILTTFIWMGVIFRFSMDNAVDSQSLSTKVVDIFATFVYKFTGKDIYISVSPSNLILLETFFRKLAHMFIYFILSINVMIVLFTFNMRMPTRMFLSLLFCFLYALSDEFHQMFVDGRGPSITDAFIDTFGAFLGVFVGLLIYCVCYTIMIKYQKSRIE